MIDDDCQVLPCWKTNQVRNVNEVKQNGLFSKSSQSIKSEVRCSHIKPGFDIGGRQQLHVRLISDQQAAVMVDELELSRSVHIGEQLSEHAAVQVFDFQHQIIVQGIVTMEWIEQNWQAWNGRFEVVSNDSPIIFSTNCRVLIAVPQH